MDIKGGEKQTKKPLIAKKSPGATVSSSRVITGF
jgi:hypothetical protein